MAKATCARNEHERDRWYDQAEWRNALIIANLCASLTAVVASCVLAVTIHWGLRPDIRAAFERLEDRIDALIREMKEQRRDLSGEIDALRTDLSGKIDAVRTDLSGRIGSLRDELREEIRVQNAATREELGGDIRALGERVARVEEIAAATYDRMYGFNGRLSVVETLVGQPVASEESPRRRAHGSPAEAVERNPRGACRRGTGAGAVAVAVGRDPGRVFFRIARRDQCAFGGVLSRETNCAGASPLVSPEASSGWHTPSV